MSNNQEEPFFSIVLSTYNADLYLENALSSIVSQESSSYEIIIIDGASIDKTINIIQNFNSKIAYFKSEPDEGIYDAWNKGIERAKGKWIYFLGADDYLIDNKALHRVEEEIKKIQEENIRVVYTMVEVIDDKGKSSWISNMPWKFLKKNFFQLNTLHHQGVFHKKDLFKINGKFNTSFKIAGDYEFLLRELKLNDPIFINTLLCCSRTGGYSTNIYHSRKALLECQRARKIHLNNSVIQIYWTFAYLKLFIKILMLKILKTERTENIISWYRKKTKKRRNIT